jgi:hypothetical protein
VKMTKSIIICALIVGLTGRFTVVARGQEVGVAQPPAPGTLTDGAQEAAEVRSESDVARANNPIAPMNSIYFQNYYAPSAYGATGSSNLLDIRSIVISGRQIIRATLPIVSNDVGNAPQVSGLGDFNVFDAFRVSPERSKDVVAVGPMLAAPTATNRALGQGKWQAGVAGVGVYSLSESSLLIGILTWQHSFAGDHSQPGAQVVTFQPIVALSVGHGYYVRSSGICSFDLSNKRSVIPVGAGVGRVFRTRDVVMNAFIEPQVTVHHSGVGQASVQLFSGLNVQFRKKTDEAQESNAETSRSGNSATKASL